MIRLSLILLICVVISGQAQNLLTLQDAIDIAMENSPTIQHAELRLERSRQSLEAQRAMLKSKFSLNVEPFTYEKNRQFNQFYNTWNTNETKSSMVNFFVSQPIYWTDGTFSVINQLRWQDSYSEFQDQQIQSYSNNLYLELTQPLFTYNRTKLATEQVELDLESTQLGYVMDKLTLEYNVTQAFYQVYNAKLNHTIAEEDYNNQQESYTIIKNKVDAGLVAKEELYQSELNLLSAESSVKNALVSLENAKDQFKNLIGLPILDEIDVAGDVSHRPVQVDAEKAIENGLEERLELQQRDIDIQLAYQTLIERRAFNEFHGELNLRYGLIGDDRELPNIYEKPTNNQRFSANFEIPLFDWGAREARIKAQEAVIAGTKLSKIEQENQIIISIRQIIRNLDNLASQVEIARKNVENAELTYEINLERYRNGDLTSMDLSLYQNQLSSEKAGLVESIINYRLELLNLKIQSMYDFVRDEPVLPESILE